jgi:putative acetyltransferase
MAKSIINTGRKAGFARLSRGRAHGPYFQPAVALCRSHGFMECQPFGDYVLDPNSIFMTLDLSIRPQLAAS